MNPQQATEAYLAAEVESSDPLHRVVLLHRGLLRALREAKGHVERQEPAAAHEDFVKAKRIVAHFLASIPEEDEGDLAAHLRGILTFCYQQITEANLRKDVACAQCAIDAITPIAEGWAELEAQQRLPGSA
ncbi:MAG: flagellar export chaperone FliS [Planctomycetota bacterium]